MLMVGARTSIAVALVAIGIGVVAGVPLGLAAAANRGSLLDEIIMRGNDLIFAFPSLVIAILITARYGPSATNAILAIGIFNIPVFVFCRCLPHTNCFSKVCFFFYQITVSFISPISEVSQFFRNCKTIQVFSLAW